MEPTTTQHPVAKDSSEGVGPSGVKRIGDVIPIALCLILTACVYSSSFVSWFHEWTRKDGYYSHAILVPFISLGIVWLRRKRLRDIQICPDALGYLLVVPSLLLTLLLTWAGGTSVQGFTFPLVVAGMILLLMGREALRELAFPVGYLYFMVVLPGFILTMLTFKTQMLSSMGATGILRMLSFDVYRDGQIIHLPNVDVAVEEACSGFKLLIALFALTVLFSYVKEGKAWAKAALIALMLPIGVALNSLRIAIVALVGEYTDVETMQMFHDQYAGIIMLAMAFGVLYLLSRLLKCDKISSDLLP